MAKYTVFDIANWFMAKAKSEGKKLKHSKLQKLVYFTYGWYFAYYDKQLFSEAIYARDHGTVVKELYHQCRYNKGQSLADDIKVLIIDKKLNSFLRTCGSRMHHIPICT